MGAPSCRPWPLHRQGELCDDGSWRQLSPMPALVLLDINMPAMTGFDVLEKVREDEFFDELPKFCVLTSSADPRDRERATTLRALGVFTKPYEIRDYVAFFDAMNDPGACTE